MSPNKIKELRERLRRFAIREFPNFHINEKRSRSQLDFGERTLVIVDANRSAKLNLALYHYYYHIAAITDFIKTTIFPHYSNSFALPGLFF